MSSTTRRIETAGWRAAGGDRWSLDALDRKSAPENAIAALVKGLGAIFYLSWDQVRYRMLIECRRRSAPLNLRSSGHFFLLLQANAMRVTAFGMAGIAAVNIQFSKGANEGAPVHSQRSGRFALIPIDLSKDNKNKLLSKFAQRFGIEDACLVHPQHQCLKLGLRGIRMFSAHV